MLIVNPLPGVVLMLVHPSTTTLAVLCSQSSGYIVSTFVSVMLTVVMNNNVIHNFSVSTGYHGYIKPCDK